MRDMGVGTDDDLLADEAVTTITEEKLEKLLLDKGVAVVASGKPSAKKAGKEVYVDRI